MTELRHVSRSEGTFSARIAEYFSANPDMVGSPLTSQDRLTDNGARFVEEFGNHFTGRSILDAGCGYGTLLNAIGEYKPSRSVGLDLASFSNPSIADKYERAIGDISKTGFPAASFDVILCLEVLEHTLDPSIAIKEFHRLLTPGGQLFVSTPNYFNVAGLMKAVLEGLNLRKRNSWAPFNFWKSQEHESFMTFIRLRNYLRESEFEIIGHRGYELFDGLFPFLNWWLGAYFDECNPLQALRRKADLLSSLPFLRNLSLHTMYIARKVEQFGLG